MNPVPLDQPASTFRQAPLESRPIPNMAGWPGAREDWDTESTQNQPDGIDDITSSGMTITEVTD